MEVRQRRNLARMRDSRLSLGSIGFEGRPGRIAVIFAGGEGRRLRPLTQEIPKSIVKVGKNVLIDFAVRSALEAGCGRLLFVLNYRHELVSNYLAEAWAKYISRFTFLVESEKRGTAGFLQSIDFDGVNEAVVLNADLIHTAPIGDLFETMVSHAADVGIVTVQGEVQLPFGVLDVQEGLVSNIREKPVVDFDLAAGIYLLRRSALDIIGKGEAYLDMPDLLGMMIDSELVVRGIPLDSPWADIASVEDLDYARAILAK